MAKKKQEKPRHEPTRRQRSRWKQQKRRQRIILGLAIIIVVAVLSVVGVGVYKGWYVSDYKPLHEVVLEVNGTEFDMEYYTDMLRFYTRDMDPAYISFMTGYVAELIQRDELVKQEAVELGITVSDEEVDELMAAQDPPLGDEYRDIVVAQLLLQKMHDEYFEERVPTHADQRYVMAMFLEGEAYANEVAARIEAGENFTDLAASLSLDSTTQEAEGDLGWVPRGILPLTVGSTLLEESAFDAEVGVVSPPVLEEGKTRMLGYWLIEVENVYEDSDPLQAEVKRILVGSEQEALDIIARLDEGESFTDLAIELSRDTASSEQGGEITVVAGETTDVFDSYVFDLGVEWGVLSQPVRDEGASLTGGYWLIEVVDSEANREIDEENRLILKNNEVENWIRGLMEDPENNIVNNLDEEKTAWAIDYITGG